MIRDRSPERGVHVLRFASLTRRVSMVPGSRNGVTRRVSEDNQHVYGE